MGLLVNILGTEEKGISELEDIHQQNPQIPKAKTTKTEKNRIGYPRMSDNYKRCNMKWEY